MKKLWEETRELSLGTSPQIPRLETPPTPLQFLRDYVSPNKPFIISSSATLDWPATTLWSCPDYLLNTLSSSSVSLHLTPSGNADSLTPISPHSLCFASPHVEKLPFSEALSKIKNSGLGAVAYAQQQNDCLREEYSAVSGDCEDHIGWATEALGCRPEAVNLWIGNEFSETWFHKDHYENLYVVVTGDKHFLLLPPTDVHRMYILDYPAANYHYSKDTGEFKLEVEDPIRYVPWCSVNPYPSPETKKKDMARFPLYFEGPKPFECTVKAGEILYLPSMWFHHVRQTPNSRGLTVAVNYWYDMRFDVKYACFNFLQSIACSGFDDVKNKENQCLKSCDEPSASNVEDGSDVAHLASGYDSDVSDNVETHDHSLCP